MDYIHVKNLEFYHPGYKDRDLKWFKCYFKMINLDPEFEMLCEIDKWRFVALIMMELQNQNPIPLNEAYLRRKGFDFKKRSMSLTLQMLHKSVEVVTEVSETCSDSVTQSKSKSKNKSKIREDKEECIKLFNEVRELYGGSKRGIETEYLAFTKKHPDWKTVLPLLLPAVQRQIDWRLSARDNFRPLWKNFSTWIFGRFWEEKLSVEDGNKQYKCGGFKCTRWGEATGKDGTGKSYYQCDVHSGKK